MDDMNDFVKMACPFRVANANTTSLPVYFYLKNEVNFSYLLLKHFWITVKSTS